MRNTFYFFISIVFLGQPQYPYDLYNLIPISGLQYAKKIELIVTIITQFQTQRCQLSVYQSTNPETAILKIQLYVKVALYLKTIGCFVSAKGLCIIIRLNSRLLPFAKFLELLNSSSVKAG